uniref:Uncharacterized protein n=1 Tax=Lepeophtheirus salmonis TaxID=72036 RepID=A0A0K2T6V7_LEPSM
MNISSTLFEKGF